MWAWDGILSGAEVGPLAPIINPWPKAQMDLDVRCRTIALPRFVHGSRGRIKELERQQFTLEIQQMRFGWLQWSINVFLKRCVVSDLLVLPSLLPVGSQTEAHMLVALGISKATPFYFITN